jgi:hypothetical protein
MPSLVAWLDASAAEQQRMREIIRLFTERESRDELGVGQVRDVISEGLFPGTSTLLTRARYLLFVPWCFQLAAGKPDPLAAADRNERILIGALKQEEDFAGLLGMRSGAALKTLPSTIYWTTLRHYGILREGFTTREEALFAPADDVRGDDEGTRKAASAWNVPPMPSGLPAQAPGGFTLPRTEAEWLCDRILEHAPDTLMSYLVEHPPSRDSEAPWEDEVVSSVTGETAALLGQARSFSTAMHGAALLYNLLLAEEYEEAGFTTLEEPVAFYQGELSDWAARAHALAIDRWDTEDLWRWVYGVAKARVAPRSARFIDEWVDRLRVTDLGHLAHDEPARRFIRVREHTHKGSQARLGNPRRVGLWPGAAGSAAITFRWPQARRVLLDIHDGLAGDA